MARYRLDADHYLYDQVVETGTIVGEGTAFLLPDDFVPSSNMTPLDDDAKRRIKDRRKEKGETWGRSPEENIPLVGDFHPIENPSTVNRVSQPKVAVHELGGEPPPGPRDSASRELPGRVLGSTLPTEDIPDPNAPKKFGVEAGQKPGEKAPGQGPEPRPSGIPGQGQDKGASKK